MYVSSEAFFVTIWSTQLLYISADDKRELEETKKRYSELSEKLMEKNRQYLKLQVNSLCLVYSISIVTVHTRLNSWVFCIGSCEWHSFDDKLQLSGLQKNRSALRTCGAGHEHI